MSIFQIWLSQIKQIRDGFHLISCDKMIQHVKIKISVML
jgi:hypothetical protein